MVKNGIWLGGASKQNAPFLKKIAPKNAPMPLMSRIGPAYLRQLLLWKHILYEQLVCYKQQTSCLLNFKRDHLPFLQFYL